MRPAATCYGASRRVEAIRTGGHAEGVGTSLDGDDLRRRACCRSEPECPLCPLAPANAQRSLAELRALGLRANLPELGL